MRSDASRNREAILRATEELLAAGESVSLDRVAEAAGVGKGTVFRRFGSRTGLFQELLAERAERLAARIATEDPAVPAKERLLGFLDELAELAGRNIALFAAHERACAEDKYADPTYLRWHAHVSALIAEARPGRDADFLAHAILGSFDGELVRHLGVERLKGSVRELASDLTS
ncbi:TetR/AcrR family transcriptional regulator [Nonomuraea africana]|uniref:AcrR family transcriptional regulator n=1 Tax=Nonomuraea africana TaxID=46171 RepID=A0ABR9KSU6_9ACTN|nr:TetR/AcrR family transcriptional regulator [Nonomuraea africana]MBE1565109.1 AcrR family transcriptional regulator [Nonomuraea africana]